MLYDDLDLCKERAIDVQIAMEAMEYLADARTMNARIGRMMEGKSSNIDSDKLRILFAVSQDLVSKLERIVNDALKMLE